MHLHFASGMLVLAIIILAAAITAVVRNWQIASGRRLMYGSVSAVMLILFSSAAFQLGTNLPILQTIDLPADETIFQVRYAGGAGAVISRRIIQRSDESRLVEHRIRRMEFTRQGIKLGNPSPSTIYWSGWWDRDGAAETPGHADIRYIVQTRELSEMISPTSSFRSWSKIFTRSCAPAGQNFGKRKRTPIITTTRACIACVIGFM